MLFYNINIIISNKYQPSPFQQASNDYVVTSPGTSVSVTGSPSFSVLVTSLYFW